jgi:hypothetical protein
MIKEAIYSILGGDDLSRDEARVRPEVCKLKSFSRAGQEDISL